MEAASQSKEIKSLKAYPEVAKHSSSLDNSIKSSVSFFKDAIEMKKEIQEKKFEGESKKTKGLLDKRILHLLGKYSEMVADYSKFIDGILENHGQQQF